MEVSDLLEGYSVTSSIYIVDAESISWLKATQHAMLCSFTLS